MVTDQAANAVAPEDPVADEDGADVVVVAGRTRYSLVPFMMKIEPLLAAAQRGTVVRAEDVTRAAGIPFARLVNKIRRRYDTLGIGTECRDGDLYLRTLEEEINQPHKRIRKIDREAIRAQRDLANAARELERLSVEQVKILDRMSNLVYSLRMATRGKREESRFLMAGKEDPLQLAAKKKEED